MIFAFSNNKFKVISVFVDALLEQNVLFRAVCVVGNKVIIVDGLRACADNYHSAMV